MHDELKWDIRKRARLTRGLLNLLKDDIDCICIDADTYDLFAIGDSINEARDTIQKIIDSVMELEYAVYQLKQNTRK
jgi:hypothetical protein